ncbi:MAG TPA: MFS transporter [Candidatus Baltobacteraceae bacterium]
MSSSTNPAAGKYPIAAATIGVVLGGAYVPTPLYELYRREWGLSPADITLVFAALAASLIPSMLFLGGISDEIGRRKTMLFALAFAAMGSLVLALAGGLWWLIAGRVLQGVALGIGVGTGAAAVREWMEPGMQRLAGEVVLIGTGVGASVCAILSGVLGQYAPYPTVLPYVVHIVLVGFVAAMVAAVPSCPHLASAGHHGLPSIRASIRRPFYLAAMQAFIGWATIAIFVSLIPSFLVRSLDLHSLLVGACVVTLVQGGLVAASLIGGSLRIRVMIISGMLALGVGLWLLLIAVPYHLYPLILLAFVVVGAGNGFSYMAGLNLVNRIAEPEHRAELLSAFLVVTYTGFSIPALAVGIVADRIGLYDAIVFAAILFGVVAIVAMLLATEKNLTPASAPAS